MSPCAWTIFKRPTGAEVVFRDMASGTEYEFCTFEEGESDADIISWIIEHCGAGDNDAVRLRDGKVCFLHLDVAAAA